MEFGLDTDSRCNFCKMHADTAVHMFCHCPILKPIWGFLDRVLQKMNFKFCFTENRKSSNFDLISSKIEKNEEKLIIYINSITNYKIWKFSMKIQYEKEVFKEKEFVKSLMKTIGGRKNIELSDNLKQCKKVAEISLLDMTIKQAFRNFYLPR